MRTKHISDEAFETWVDGADQLRTHSVQAAFRQGWNKGEEHAGLHCPHTETIEQIRTEAEQLHQKTRRNLDTFAAMARAIKNDAEILESGLLRHGQVDSDRPEWRPK